MNQNHGNPEKPLEIPWKNDAPKDAPNYFFDESTGDGVKLPSVQMNLPGLRYRIEEVLKNYISPRHNIATDKIAEELETIALIFHTSNR